MTDDSRAEIIAGGLVLAVAAGFLGLAAGPRLMPAGAIYYNMDEQDVRRVLRYPVTMIGSDGLPNDPMPHPRLWGAFPRVLGHYCRDERLFPLTIAIHKMTGLSAARFQLADRGLVKVGYFADLVLFDPDAPFVLDRFTLRSKSKNTPFDGARMEGRVLGTWVAGQRVYGGEP